MAAPRSTQLGVGSYPSGSYSTIYTVPSGKRTILKHLWVRNTHNLASVIAFNVDTAGGTNVYMYYYLAAAGSSGDSQSLDVWVVLNAGDKLKVAPTQSSVDVIASGAELID